MEKCSYPRGLSIKPDGVNELDPCIYEEIEAYENVSVSISKCKKCGHIEVTWKRQPNTKEIKNDSSADY